MGAAGLPFFAPLTVAASAPGADVSFAVPTLEASATGADASFELLSAASEATGGGVATTGGSLQFAPLTATSAGSAGSAGEGDADFEAATAEAFGPTSASPSFEAATAEATGLTGGVAFGDAYFRPFDVAAANVSQGVSVGAGQFVAATAAGLSQVTHQITGAAEFRRLVGAGAALVGGVASASPSFEPMEASSSPSYSSVGVGEASFVRPYAAAAGSAVLSAAIRTWVMNAGNRGLTEYQSYPANSYAEFNGSYYSASDDGIFQLSGATDDGEAIAWTFRTGLMDDRKASGTGLKRLEEVLFSARFDGPFRVRVWTDDNSYFDYNVNNFRSDVLHQVRAKTGRGSRSRYYRIEVTGVGNTSAEFHSMQAPMVPLSRRLG